jgi:hypothetical protein
VTVLVVVDAEELRRLIREAVAAALPTVVARDEWVDAHSSGLGRRTFLRLARERAFPVSKVGKRYVARRTDVASYLEQQRVQERSRDRPVAPRASHRELRAHRPIDTDASSIEGDDPVARALAQGRLRVLKGSP